LKEFLLLYQLFPLNLYLPKNIMSSPPSISPAKRKSDDIAVENQYEFFIPKKKEVRNFGRTTLMLYPDVTSDMPDQERSLAFQTNSDALKNSRTIKYHQKLTILGEGMGCSTLVEIELGVFKNSSFVIRVSPAKSEPHSSIIP
jgi:hypothetical protein